MTLRILRLVVAAAAVAIPMELIAQDYSCDDASTVEVRHLSITGNKTFSGALLKDGIVTEATPFFRRHINWNFLGSTRCVDSLEFARDSARLSYYYKRAGFQSVEVEKNIKTTGKRAVDVDFRIREGPPVIVDTLRFLGADSVADRSWLLHSLALHQGDRFDQLALRTTIDTVTRRMHDNGYPAGDILAFFKTDSAKRFASVALTLESGFRARLGTVDVTVHPRDSATQQISNATVRSLLGLKEGSLYRLKDLERANRNLFFTQDFHSILVAPDSVDLQYPGDSVVGVRVDVTEGLRHSVRAGLGYGTLDCFRADGELHDYDFAAAAWRLDLTGRLSKIGIGRPLAGATPLCWELRDDPYSTTLNYYGGATFSAPTALRLGLRPSFTVYSETHSEFNAFIRTTPIGAILAATRQGSNRRTQTISYQLELGHTEAQPAVFCALENLCLDADRAALEATKLVATAGWSVSQDWSNDPQNPTQGGVAKFELRHASKAIGSDARVQFSKGTIDASMYIDVGRGMVLSPRLRVGAVVGPAFSGTSAFIPSQERLFAGGANSVRGFAQNDLGPKVYIASVFDTVRAHAAPANCAAPCAILPTDTVYFHTPPGISAERSVPTGGSALTVGNIELRVPSIFHPELFQFSFFVDAGELWSPGAEEAQDRYQGLKVTPGFGVRIATPVGPFRIDVAFNPYSPRAGAAFFDTPFTQGGQLYCVSPGNTLAVTGINGLAGVAPKQVSGTCVRDFQPPTARGFLNRLTFQFGIGQAY